MTPALGALALIALTIVCLTVMACWGMRSDMAVRMEAFERRLRDLERRL